ncbi:hypothetical protein [Pseudofrankia sp. BMG5.36]|uniref:hypothetical protein n=1 Tax=Pseudofrankia sp. BMG5.36 TaxID=1834512 RepID=UPI0032D5B0AE
MFARRRDGSWPVWMTSNQTSPLNQSAGLCRLEPVYAVHYNDYAAHLQGAQIAYDVGVQRTCWQVQSLTNRMGDAGTLKHIHGQYRSHVYLSDVVRPSGRVTGKHLDQSGDNVVEIETWATNQRGQNVMPGTATVALPRRP